MFVWGFTAQSTAKVMSSRSITRKHRSWAGFDLLSGNQYLESTLPVVTDNYRWVITAETTIFQYVQDRRDEKTHKKTAHQSRTYCKHSRSLALLYAKAVGCPGTGSYPAQSPNPTTHHFEVKCRAILTHNPEVWCSYMKQSLRYTAKLLDHEI